MPMQVCLCVSVVRGMSSNPGQQSLVESLKAKGLLNDPLIEAAFLAVPRHLFVPGMQPEEIYVDKAITTKREPSGLVVSSSSQPSMMLLMLRQLKLQPGHNVLEIGTGTGYNAAIMQHIVGTYGRVTTVEIDPEVAKQAEDNLQHALFGSITVVRDDGASGYAPRAMYDRIICTAAVWDLPPAWVRQLKDNGIIVTPIQIAGTQVCAAFRCEPDGTLYSAHNLPCWFVEMRGSSAGTSLIKRVGSTGLTLSSINIEQLDTASLALLLSDDHDICHTSEPIEKGDDRFWFDFLPYAMLNVPKGYTLAMYIIPPNEKAYGMEGSGFALISRGSATFVPYLEGGATHCYAGADAFLALEALIAEWKSVGSPTVRNLRLRLYPKTQDKPEISVGDLGERPHYYIHAWLDTQ